MPRFAYHEGKPANVWLPKSGKFVTFFGGTYATEDENEIADLETNRNVYKLGPEAVKPEETEEFAVEEVPLPEDPTVTVTMPVRRGPGRPRKN